MIGSLIAGGTFCPLNLEGPQGRNAVIARVFAPAIVLYDGTPPSFLGDIPAATSQIDVSRLGPHSLDGPATEYNEVAYVVFTSGSTGQPKGVKIGRAGFSHFLAVARSYFDLPIGQRWGQFSNLGYDLAIMDVFMAATQGATLVPLTSPKERFMPALAIKERRIAVWQSVPSVLEMMILANQVSPDHLASLKVVSFCGEPLLPRHLDALFSARPDLQVLNTYGATETTGFNTVNRLTSANYRNSCEAPTVALGEEIPGWAVSLHGGDSADDGEIVVSGDFLSLGYWNDEDRTREVFRQLRPEGACARRSYFTGDRGVMKNGRLYFSSRVDRQVKIRGERIELDEIDCVLREAGFRAAFTVLVGEELHSFVESGGKVDEKLVRAQLAKRLPFHALPRTVSPLSSLPRNPNGKIDGMALRQRIPRRASGPPGPAPAAWGEPGRCAPPDTE